MTKLACGFAGGMGGTFDEGTCGAVTGALIANGILNDDPSEIKANAKEIFNAFKEEYGTVRCDIISKNGEDKSPCVDCKTEFDEERKTCENLTHIEEEISSPALIEIDRLFGAADVLSIKYAQKHYNKVRNISIIAPLIVFLFLLYDEAELHILIFAVLLLIIILYLIYRKANNENVHDTSCPIFHFKSRNKGKCKKYFTMAY